MELTEEWSKRTYKIIKETIEMNRQEQNVKDQGILVLFF